MCVADLDSTTGLLGRFLMEAISGTTVAGTNTIGTTFDQMKGWGWQSVHNPEAAALNDGEI